MIEYEKSTRSLVIEVIIGLVLGVAFFFLASLVKENDARMAIEREENLKNRIMVGLQRNCEDRPDHIIPLEKGK